MSTTQEVALLFTSKDLTRTGIESVTRNVFGLTSAFKGQNQQVQQNINLARNLTANQGKLSAAYTAETQAIQRHNIALQQQRLVYDQISLAQSKSLAIGAASSRAQREAQAAASQQFAAAVSYENQLRRVATQAKTINDIQAAIAHQPNVERVARTQRDIAAGRVLSASDVQRLIVPGAQRVLNNPASTPAELIKAQLAIRNANLGVASSYINLEAAQGKVNRTQKEGLDLVTKLNEGQITLGIEQAKVAESAGKLAAADTRASEAKARSLDLTTLQAEKNIELAKENLALARSDIAVATSSDARAAAIHRVILAQDELASSTKAQALIAAGGNKGPGFLAKAGPGLVIGATALTLVAAYEASKRAFEFQGTEATLAGQTKRTYSDVQTVGQAALKYAQSGQSLYNPTQLLQGTLLDLSRDIPAKVVAGIVPIVAKASGILHQPDLTLEGLALSSLLGYAGTGKHTTVAGASKLVDLLTAAEQKTPRPAAEVTAAIPRLLTAFNDTGVSLPDILGAEVQLVRATGASPSVASSWLGQLARSSIIKPTAGAQKLAGQLNVDLGSRGLAEAGGNPFVYWSNLYAATGGNIQKLNVLTNPDKNAARLTPVELSAQLITGGGGGSGINALRAFLALNKGGNLQAAAGLSDIFSASQGTVGATYKGLQVGQQQQASELANKFNSDLTQIGLTINKDVIPALIGLSLAALNAGEGIVKQAQQAGSQIDKLFPGLTKFLKQDITNVNPSALPGVLKAFVDGFKTNFVNGTLLSPLTTQEKRDREVKQGSNVPYVPGAYTGPTGYVPKGGSGSPYTNVPRTPGSILPQFVLPTSGDGYVNVPNNPELFPGYIPTGKPVPSAIRKTGGRAYKQNLYTNPAQIIEHENLLDTLARASSVSTAYSNANALLGVDINKKQPSAANTQQVGALRDLLVHLLKDPALTAGGFFTKAQLIKAQGAVTHDANTYINKVNYDAATTQLKAANLQYQNSLLNGSTQAKQDALADKVYNKTVAQIDKSGLKPGSNAYNAAILGAKDVRLRSYGQDITQPLNDAQARLQLATDKGQPLGSARAAILALYKEQLKIGTPAAGGLTQAGYDLVAYELYHPGGKSATASTPGPRLLRPNVAGLGGFGGGFSSETSRINTPGDDSASQTIQRLETLNHTLEQENGYLRSIVGAHAVTNKHLANIEKQGRSGGATRSPSLATARVQ